MRTILLLTAFAASFAPVGNGMAAEMPGKGADMHGMAKGMVEEDENMHGATVGMHDEGFSFGMMGVPGDVSRTIEIELTDNAFNVSAIDVKAGETIRFKVHNAGEVVHEFNIATGAMHMEHQAEMMKMLDSGALDVDRIDHSKMSPGMMHNDPNSVLLEPGQSGEIIWHFEKADNVEFACNVPGHYEGGMKGQIIIHGE